MSQAQKYRTSLVQLATRDNGDDPDYCNFIEAFCAEISDDYLTAVNNPRQADRDAILAQNLWRKLREVRADDVSIEVRIGAKPNELTQLQIIHPDMPFLTDSVLMDLTHHELAIHFLHNLTFACHDNADGRQTIIHVEIDPLNQDEADALVTRVTDGLRDVRAAVSDYHAMQDIIRKLTRELESMPDEEQSNKAQEYLTWLLDDHFTFLGYREFSYSDGIVRQVENSNLGTMRNREPASERAIADMRATSRAFLAETSYLSFSKSGTRSRVHRPAYPDYVGVKRFDSDGRVIGECGFYGLYTSPVYTDHPNSIPIVRDKTKAVLAKANLDPRGFDGKNLAQILMTYPRDELFVIDVETLYRTALAVAHIHERRQTRLFLRPDRYGLFYNCLVYLPRELYNTNLRIAIERLLRDRLQAQDIEFEAFFSESILIRLQFILRVDPLRELAVDVDELEAEIVAISYDWHHSLKRGLVSAGEFEPVADLYTRLPLGYEDYHDVAQTHADLLTLRGLGEGDDVRVEMHPASGQYILRLLTRNGPIALSRVMPMLENLGFDVQNERSFVFGHGEPSVHEYIVTHHAIAADVDYDAENLTDSILCINRGTAENDGFNQLVICAGLSWREVALLRAYSAYMKQVGFAYDESFLISTLVKHNVVARALVSCFLARFDPAGEGSGDFDVDEAVADVALLNEDQAIRKYFELLQATVRTNYFQQFDPTAQGSHGTAGYETPLALKLLSSKIEGLPKPVPAFEIFVFGPSVEGIHLRSSPVARGGIRWSDRTEDYRTEVLDLMKTQVVKNALIVPSGAKGGFLVKSHAAEKDAGLACYRLFISSLLDITDNIVEGEIIHPELVRCHDGNDPYLVVAADKGTASFSDQANELALSRNFWLGDAFASGGKTGYDHKKMGITAKGAWISVARHFKERGIDVQTDAVTVIGIGDMSGDVFGNGLLSSESLRLVGAFNHNHIFLDPDPDAAGSFAERRRLYDEALGWDGYDHRLISNGGGVFERSVKSIDISAEVGNRLGITAQALSPQALISHMLRAEVDLLWNGGVGTYVKATAQRHADVGDRANDHLRVDASQLRCKVIGEGGNLGMTQAARVEFATNGGGVTGDFIDNSGGVDCSDHEVNLKILLDRVVSRGAIDVGERNALMRDNEAAVAALVLDNNERQTQALSVAVQHASARLQEYGRVISFLEQQGHLDRELHSLPGKDELDERIAAAQPLTRPELAIVMCCAKNWLKTELRSTGIADDPLIQQLLARQFPAPIVERFKDNLGDHPLAPDIIATQLTNEIVDHVGMTFMHKLQEISGASPQEIVVAYLLVARLFAMTDRWDEVESSCADGRKQIQVLLDYVHFGHQATRWVLQRHRGAVAVSALLEHYRGTINTLLAEDPESLLGVAAKGRFRNAKTAQETAGFDGAMSAKLALTEELCSLLSIAEVASTYGQSVSASVTAFNAAGGGFAIDALYGVLRDAPAHNHWQWMERDTLLDELASIKARLAGSIAMSGASVEEWCREREVFSAGWQRIVELYRSGDDTDFAFAALTIRKLNTLLDLSRV